MCFIKEHFVNKKALNIYTRMLELTFPGVVLFIKRTVVGGGIKDKDGGCNKTGYVELMMISLLIAIFPDDVIIKLLSYVTVTWV